ncbi:hypothetical protein GmHk_10G028043 [Glycine max]|nr:hypothetical protein GmHk_10G028043 [Glycine max]
MTLIVQCVNMSNEIKVEEYFLEFLKGYDSGSNMKEKHQGVQKCFLEINPRALYMSCVCHSLNLTAILLDNVLGLTIKSLSNTSWESQIKSIKAISLALLELHKSYDDAKSKSEAESLVNALESFEFLLGMFIWYDILFAINMYRDDGFTSNVVEMTITSLKNRFEQLKSFERIFGFLFTSKKLKSLDGNDLRESCVNIHSTFSHGDLLDVDLDYFFFEFNVLQFIKVAYCYQNISIAYRVLLIMLVTVASTKRSFSKLELIKTYLRSSMSQERLTGLTILSIEKDM